MHVLLADDQAKVRSAMRLLFEQDPDIEVIGEAVDATGLLDWVGAVCPDMVLLDWELPGGAGEELLSAIRASCSLTSVVALSGRPEARPAALDAGADAFVSKGDPPERLIEAVRACARNGTAQPTGALRSPGDQEATQ
jgi:DNA-binding NarL/FixJ family response regulator